MTYSVKSNDGKKHDVQLYVEAGKQWAVDQPTQPSVSAQGIEEGFAYVCTGSKSQQILGKKGDDLRIDWGYFYMAAPEEMVKTATGDGLALRKNFSEGTAVNSTPASDSDKLVLVSDLGKTKSAQGHILLAYDDIFSIQYFGENLRPYWNRSGCCL